MTVSVTEYAAAHEISRQAVLKKIHKKKLAKGERAKKVGKVWVITVKSSERL